MDIYEDSKVKELSPKDLEKNGNKTHLRHEDFKGKPTLIKFYAPWCPHCTNLKPILEELVEKFDHKDFKVGAVNCDKHQMDGLVEIEGYPTLYFVKRSTGHLIKYDGPRDIEHLSKFITDHYKDDSKGDHTKEADHNIKSITNQVKFSGELVTRHNYIVTVNKNKTPHYVLNGVSAPGQKISVKIGEQLYFDQTGVSNTSIGKTDSNHPITITHDSQTIYYLNGESVDYKDFKENFQNKEISRVVIFTPVKKGSYYLECGIHGKKMGCDIIAN